jgi:ubiquinone/menaquinone biosynthesis C-methylase UbiE
MNRTFTSSAIPNRPLVYAGRFADRISDEELPENVNVLDDWEVLPWQLAPAVRNATALIILDPFSFPFEAMAEEQWDVPLVLVLPPKFGAGFLQTVFGGPIFERLGFFDRVATDDSELWERLLKRYHWLPSQRIALRSALPEASVADICARLEAETVEFNFFGGERYEALSYWRGCGDTLASLAPRRAVFGAHCGSEFGKAVHRVQAAAIEPQFVAAWGDRTEESPFDVLEVGVGVGRWASRFDPTKTDFVGVDVSEGMVNAARADLPDHRFDLLGDDLLFPYPDESFDLVFGVAVMHHNASPAKRTLLSEMWRVARPGARMLFLEDFVAEKRSERSTIYPMSVLEFVDLILEATAGRVVLEHVESLRYPGDPFSRGGLLALSKLGVPASW